MKGVRCVIGIVFLALSVGKVSAQATIHDLLSGDACQLSCFLGIQPGITAQSELEQILNAAGITFSVDTLGLEGDSFIYSFKPTHPIPFVKFDVWALVANNTINQVAIDLEGVTVNDVLAQYGAPEKILDDGGSYDLVYPDQGLLFNIPPEDNTRISSVMIRTEAGIRYIFVDSINVVDLQPCETPTNLCQIKMKTRAVNTNGTIRFSLRIVWALFISISHFLY